MLTLLINADDFGLSQGVNEAIEIAHTRGMLTSASALVNMPAFDEAIAIARRNPQLKLGLHLCLTSGQSILPPSEIPLLTNERGEFRFGFTSLWRALAGKQSSELLRQITLEWEAQARRITAQGIPVSHCDSHRHVHMLPGLFEATAWLARRHGWRMRISREPFDAQTLTHSGIQGATVGQLKRWLLNRWVPLAAQLGRELARSDRCFGIVESGRVTTASLRRRFQRLPQGVTEIITHPSLSPQVSANRMAAVDVQFARSPLRKLEFEALVDPDLLDQWKRIVRTHQFDPNDQKMAAA